jgi:NMD protein affecting ribosome stability and mRNA decay
MPAPQSDVSSREVVIECRVTGRLVRTGLHVTDRADIPDRNELTACEACGQNHRWSRFEATLID